LDQTMQFSSDHNSIYNKLW